MANSTGKLNKNNMETLPPCLFLCLNWYCYPSLVCEESSYSLSCLPRSFKGNAAVALLLFQTKLLLAQCYGALFLPPVHEGVPSPQHLLVVQLLHNTYTIFHKWRRLLPGLFPEPGPSSLGNPVAAGKAGCAPPSTVSRYCRCLKDLDK